MGISGNLKTMQLAELLQWLSMGQKSGTLKIEKSSSKVCKRMFFDGGVIISSASTDPGEYLGRFLVSHGYMGEEEVNAAVAKQKQENKLLGKILVSMELISECDLHQMLRLKSEESIYDVFTWDEGAFEFLDGELPGENMVRMDLDVQWIILEGSRRMDEWSRIRELVPSSLCVPVLVRDPEQLELEDFARSLLAWVDDERTIEEISQGAMTNLFQVSEIMAEQVQAGSLKVVKPRIIEIEVPVKLSEEAEAAELVAKQNIDPNESGTYFLPMMQQMMAQYQQQMQTPPMYGQPPGQAQPGMLTPAAPMPPTGFQTPAPAQPPVDLGGGRSLNFAQGAVGAPDAAAAAMAAPLPPVAENAAEKLLAAADAALHQGELADALATYREAKTAEGSSGTIESKAKAGEDKVQAALEKDGIDLKSVPKLNCEMGDLTKLDISPQEGFLLTRVDGSYDIKSILQMSPMPKVDAQILFWRLKRGGQVAI